MKVKELIPYIFEVNEKEEWLELCIYTKYSTDDCEIAKFYSIKKKYVEIPKEIMEADIKMIFVDWEGLLSLLINLE